MTANTAGIVIIGDEILLGRVTDTNSGAIARALDTIGFRTTSITTVGDTPEAIRTAVRRTLDSCNVVFTTGGLGPTKDDITKSVLCEIFGGKLSLNQDVTRNIEQIFAHRKLRLNKLTRNQALVPDSAKIIQNRLGTAPIMVFERDGKMLISMPGVPYETEGMLPEVIDYIRQIYSREATIRHATRVVAGMSESALAMALDDFEKALPQNYKLAYLPDSPLIKLRVDCYGDDSGFADIENKLDETLFGLDNLNVFTHGDKSLAQIVIENLRINSLTLSTAESCTGGNIARELTAIPGASEVFTGSVVSYANSVKTGVLKVSEKTLEEHGAVSGPVVRQMAKGVSELMDTECAIATSGIAGPGGGTAKKPVGTVWIAVKTPGALHCECHTFGGDRANVIRRATSAALLTLLQSL